MNTCMDAICYAIDECKFFTSTEVDNIPIVKRKVAKDNITLPVCHVLLHE